MTVADRALNILVAKNALWRSEIRHESMLLMASLAHKDPTIRAQLYELITNGPPENLKIKSDRLDYMQFELLSFLDARNDVELPVAAKEVIDKGQSEGWDPDLDHPGMSVYSVNSDRYWPEPEHPSLIDPADAVHMMTEADPDADWSARDKYEAFGYWALEDNSWGVDFLDSARSVIGEIHPGAMNPFLWGVRKAISQKKHESQPTTNLLQYLESLVDVRQDAELWSSLPSVIQELTKQSDVAITHWGSLATKLGITLVSFDYDRQTSDEPIGWLNRSINHPIGTLVELYLDVAQSTVAKLHDSGSPIVLDEDARRFFELMLGAYDAGSRYAICILSKAVSWFEAIDSEWTESHLVPYFIRTDQPEASIVAWSGYAWSNRLSRHLSQDFEHTYLPALQDWQSFGQTEQRGLMQHVGAIAWYGWCDEAVLIKATDSLPPTAWASLIKSMIGHLRKAEPETGDAFIDAYLLPLWRRINGRANELDSSQAEVLEALWRILPFTGSHFIRAAELAIAKPPSRIGDLHFFSTNFERIEVTRESASVLVDVLIELLAADQSPHWHVRDWRVLWQIVMNCDVPRLQELRQNFARRDINIDE